MMRSQHLIYVIIFLLSLAGFSRSFTMEFEQEPDSVYVTPRDDKKNLRCVVGPNKAKISWLQDGVEIDRNNKYLSVHHNRLAIHLNPPVHNQQFPDIWKHEYQCKAQLKGYTLLSSPGKLIKAELHPFLQHSDEEIHTTSGNIAVIPCHLPYSMPKAVSEFSLNGQKIERTGRHIFLPSGDLQILDVRPEDSGSYQCSAFNPLINTRETNPSQIHLKVEESTKLKNPNFVIKPKTTTETLIGTNTTLECLAQGNPPPDIYWYREDNEPLPEGRYVLYGGNLVLFGTQITDEGVYVCQATNNPDRNKPIKTKTNLQVGVPAEVIKHSYSLQEAEEKENVTLKCRISGNPAPVVSWYHNGLRLGEDYKPINNGTASWRIYRLHANSRLVSVLELKQVNKKQTGAYQCFVSNAHGFAHGDTHLVIYRTHSNSNERQRKKKQKKHHNNNKNQFPPSRPIITKLNPRSVLVRWSLPEQSQESDVSVLFFKIQYKTNDNHLWMTLDDEINGTFHKWAVDKLEPSKEYTFRIAAVYDNDQQETSLISHTYTTPGKQGSISSPVFTTIEALDDHVVKASWFVKHSESILGYNLFIREVGKNKAQKFNVEGSATSYIVLHLNADTMYEVALQAYSPTNVSPLTNWTKVKTKNRQRENEIDSAEQAQLQDNSNFSSIQIIQILVPILICLAGFVLVIFRQKGICKKLLRKLWPIGNNDSKPAPEASRVEMECLGIKLGSTNNNYSPPIVLKMSQFEDRLSTVAEQETLLNTPGDSTPNACSEPIAKNSQTV